MAFISYFTLTTQSLWGSRIPSHSPSHQTVTSARSPALEAKNTCNQGRSEIETERRPRVVIVGGGAGGHLAAISLHNHLECHALGHFAHVEMYEGAKEVLGKVKRSGGGRCNVTNVQSKEDIREFSGNYPRGNRVMPGILHRYGPDNIMELLESHGVKLKVEGNGKIFPVSNSSLSIIQCLQGLVTEECGVKVTTNTRIRDVEIDSNGVFTLSVENKVKVNNNNNNNNGKSRTNIQADYVVVATGSDRLTWAWVNKLGHSIVPPVPSLFSFGISRDPRLEDLAGLSVADVLVTLKLTDNSSTESGKGNVLNNMNKSSSSFPPSPSPKRRKRRTLSERGPLLITHWGLSGPAVLSLSAFGARELHSVKYRMECEINWIPYLSNDDILNDLKMHRVKHPRKQMLGHYPQRLARNIPKRLWERLVKGRHMTWNETSDKMLTDIVAGLQRTPFTISSKGQFKDEFVTAGGVDLKQVDMKTLCSKVVDGLCFAGETLDVDAKTGGYNLQFAWSSGWIVGHTIADSIIKKNGAVASEDKGSKGDKISTPTLINEQTVCR